MLSLSYLKEKVVSLWAAAGLPDVSLTGADETSALDSFLHERKQSFLSEVGSASNRWTVVTGNEAGDLDSIASSVAYAYLSSNPNMISLVQTPRSDLHLRPENAFAFSLASLDIENLLTTSDISSGISAHNLDYVLVDHNRLLPSCKGNVVAILDHHEDERQHLEANPRIIRPAGSCASLVTTQFRESWATRPTDELKSVAMLLLSAILIDTDGLKPGGKAVDVDHDAVQLLVPHTGLVTSSSIVGGGRQPPVAVEALSRRLATAKSSVEHLSMKDLLRRDYKEYDLTGARVGLSTVPVGLKVLVKRNTEQFWGDMDGWMSERKLDVLGVLTTYRSAKKRKHRRQLLFVVRPGQDKVESALFEGIARDRELQCEERRIAGVENRRARCWRQGNAKATRKVVAPLVKRLVETL
ncbi:SubName: Full=Uncharacterized protein {ECO:0000313/EMBL:CCA69622.1} [Serendipita indica DSM 11827]|nr:SubName: Full=Uncharacterized protein {ECO:0000313/EMBL:CCA69622.1} [Serendipita indica DSM 11827]